MSRIIQSDNPLYPRVKITDNLMKQTGGNISVDLDGINELLRDDLGLDEDVTPKYTLYGDGSHSALLGLHVPFSHTALVNVPASNAHQSASSTLVHESVHLVDSIHHPIRTTGEVGLRVGAHKVALLGAATVAEFIPGPGLTDWIAGAVTYYNLRLGLYYRHLDPSENRARRIQNDDYYKEKYADLIKVGHQAGRLTLM